MSLILSGTDGLSDVDGSAATPAIRGTDANTGIFFGTDIIGFSEGGVEAARINADSQFVAAAGTAALPVITTTGDTNTGIFFPAADTIAFSEGGAEAMRIDSSGNVGIGTTSPAARLSVDSSSTGLMAVLNSTAANGGYIVGRSSGTSVWDIGTSLQTLTVGTSTDMGINVRSGFLALGTANTERMRIDSSGNLLVGTTSTNPAASRVSGSALGADGAIRSRSGAGLSYFGISVTSGTNISFYTDNGSALVGGGNISTNGGTTSYNGTSDYRLKNNVQPLTNAIDRVALLKPVKWIWKDGFGGTQPEGEGFIAHELAEIIPSAVTGEKDAVDEDGNPVYQGLDTRFLVATLTAAIQEQQALIQSLTARITALETP